MCVRERECVCMRERERVCVYERERQTDRQTECVCFVSFCVCFQIFLFFHSPTPKPANHIADPATFTSNATIGQLMLFLPRLTDRAWLPSLR